MLKRLFHPPDERGQSLVEYALILILASIVVIVILLIFGDSVRELYCEITGELDPYFHLGSPEACEVEEETTWNAPLSAPIDAIAAIPIT